jgi:hypothetical protein
VAPKLKLDSPGILEVLQSAQVAAVVEGLAETIAGSIDETARNGDPVRVLTEGYTTDRAAAAVILAHPAGLGKEAKHGTLTRAAASAGLEVNASTPE